MTKGEAAHYYAEKLVEEYFSFRGYPPQFGFTTMSIGYGKSVTIEVAGREPWRREPQP